jgi:hypothetical protein
MTEVGQKACTFKENGNFTFSFVDQYGNTGSLMATVAWIFKSSGGGGSVSLKKDECVNGDFSASYYDGACGEEPSEEKTDQAEDEPNPESGVNAGEDEAAHNTAGDEQGIYERAKEYGLTSMPTYEAFRPSDNITRSELAKVVVAYAKSKTDLRPKANVACSQFRDLNEVNPELQDYIIQACELGLMGLFSDGKTVKTSFNPNDAVILAEVATTVSRLLWGELYEGTEEQWYQNHLFALGKEEMIKTDRDPMMVETRENTFWMFKRITSL